jgi:hypothetical protein
MVAEMASILAGPRRFLHGDCTAFAFPAAFREGGRAVIVQQADDQEHSICGRSHRKSVIEVPRRDRIIVDGAFRPGNSRFSSPSTPPGGSFIKRRKQI